MLTPVLISTTTLSLQDENDLVYGGFTDTAATLVFEEIISPGDVTSEQVTQVVATDVSFKVFEEKRVFAGFYSSSRANL